MKVKVDFLDLLTRLEWLLPTEVELGLRLGGITINWTAFHLVSYTFKATCINLSEVECMSEGLCLALELIRQYIRISRQSDPAMCSLVE